MIERKTELPQIFESFAEARQNGFLAMKKIKDSGKGVVGQFCTYTPLEIFMAAGLVSVGLCSTSDETIPEAEKVLPSNLCPLIKSSYGFAITDKCPYMYFSDLVVGETTCDGKVKMYELLAEIKNVHILELPRRQDTPEAKALWLAELVRLKERVEKDFGVTITDDNLRDAIRRRNIERRLLKELYELSTMTPPPITGLRQLQILFGSQFKFDWDEKVAEIQNAIDSIKAAYAAGERPVADTAPRILITGCPMGGVTEKVVKVIEEAGAVVVAYENCTGAKQLDRQCPEAGDPMTSIADHYLQIGCAIMTPDKNRFELLERLCEQFQVDGVVEMTLQACHPYAVEAHSVKEFMQKKGIPYLQLETDYGTADIGQLSTRAGAFVEML
ncbi:double-cubane-cluster-containing anaerobic reductase [Sporomusa sp. GT1]|uniref:double-cubane-cluster-containing anaerobic reductase n=1 Tax=Sporomusa sp. GT1 TaxID=1534747 RepID=UPI00166909C5|nr:double-cubane-cluster-containing anaerobic reductase [Sporomusa sp. GT1]